ncbi:hypothetical protein ACQKDB_16010 [Planococcus kocurii]|uniref:hypothetical protein n=1 Tax=Planococcus kocurii TaxID=1374 RepID=UPI003CFEB14D
MKEKIVKARNGYFIIKETEEGCELWQVDPHIWLENGLNLLDFKEIMGAIYSIS